MAKKKIYDDGGTTVTVQESAPKAKPVSEKTTATEIMELKLSDIADAFAGYLIPQVSLMEMGEGKCVICGKETNSEMRKICMECFKKYKYELYNALSNACNGTVTIGK